MEDIRVGHSDAAADDAVRYRYRPLDHAGDIRVLRVSSSKDSNVADVADGSLSCEVIHVNIDSDPGPQYYSISYAWGDTSRLRPFATVGNRFLEISDSLYVAIHTIYRVLGRRTINLWADQVCIDQENRTERGEQVELMGKIFQRGYRSIVWLGEAGATTRAAYDFMYMLAHSTLSLPRSEDLYYNGDVDGLWQYLDIWKPDEDELEAGTTALIDLSERPWFTRLWTFQEFILAPRLEFICGTHRCSRFDVVRAFFVTRLLRDCRSAGMHHAACLWRYRHKYLKERPRPMLELLRDVNDSGYQCTDPNDRVYAILALHTDRLDIPVSYNMDVEELMYETAKAIIRHDRDLRVLCRRRTGISSSLPSWVPDWTASTFNWNIDDRRAGFAASKGYSYEFEERGSKVLVTHGKAVASIVEVVDHAFPDQLSAHEDGYVDRIICTGTLIPRLHATLEAILRARGVPPGDVAKRIDRYLARTFTCGRFREAHGRGPESSAEGDEPTSLSDTLAAQSFSVRQAMQKCKGRKLAILDSLSWPIALVPDYVMAGDRVCVLNGSPTPLILREAGEFFENQSECFVHGIMYGEAVDWPEGGGEVFRII